MPKFLIQASYTAEGAKGLIKDGGSGRRAAVEALFKAAGGRMESCYFAFGDSDVYVVGELPDNATATSLALAVNQTGAVRLRTTVLLSAEEVDQAVKKTVAYRAPGR